MKKGKEFSKKKEKLQHYQLANFKPKYKKDGGKVDKWYPHMLGFTRSITFMPLHYAPYGSRIDSRQLLVPDTFKIMEAGVATSLALLELLFDMGC
jgi:hypothetical protein